MQAVLVPANERSTTSRAPRAIRRLRRRWRTEGTVRNPSRALVLTGHLHVESRPMGGSVELENITRPVRPFGSSLVDGPMAATGGICVNG